MGGFFYIWGNSLIMLQQLINITNDPFYYHNSDIRLESYAVNANANNAEIILSVNQISYDEPVEYQEWKIICSNLERLQGLNYDLMMPYVKIQLFDKNPLLYDFHDALIEANIIGKPYNIEQYISALAECYEQITGNWKSLHENFWLIRENYSDNDKSSVSVSETLFKSLIEIFEKHNMQIKNIKRYIGEVKGYLDKPNAKVLIFGNSDVSLYEFNLGQPYVIAETFEAERIR